MIHEKVLAMLSEHNMLKDAACFSLDKDINAALRSKPEFFLCSEVTKVRDVSYHKRWSSF